MSNRNILDNTEKRILKHIFSKIKPVDEGLEVGESWILLTSDYYVEKDVRDMKDEIDKLLSEFNIDDKLVAISQRPPTSQVVTPMTGENELRPIDAAVGIGIERIN